MKSLTDLQWYDSNGNLVKSYDANNKATPAILYFQAPVSPATSTPQPILLELPSDYASKTYVLKCVNGVMQWVAEV